jgi:hypothetical protein
MTFIQLDQLIRETMPDGPERRNILSGVNDLSEGINQMLGFLLSTQSWAFDEVNETWKQKKTVIRQVNNPLR